MRFRTLSLRFLAIAILFEAALSQVGVLPRNDTRLKGAVDPKFTVGDVWEYKTRRGEELSRVTIVKLDSSPELGIIVHVAIDNLTWKNCQNNPIPEAVPHMPFARKAFAASVTRRIATGQSFPGYQNGYGEWLDAYSNGQAGIYVIPVERAVSIAEKTYREGIGCE